MGKIFVVQARVAQNTKRRKNMLCSLRGCNKLEKALSSIFHCLIEGFRIGERGGGALEHVSIKIKISYALFSRQKKL